MATHIWINSVPGNGLLSDDTKSLTNADFWLVKFWGIYMGVMSQRKSKVQVCIMSFKINFKLLPHVTGSKELKKIHIFRRYVSDFFAHNHTQKTIPSTTLVPFRPCSPQFWFITSKVGYQWRLQSVFCDHINSHKTIYRTLQSNPPVLCSH